MIFCSTVNTGLSGITVEALTGAASSVSKENSRVDPAGIGAVV